MYVLVLNPGGNSLKVELIDCQPEQRYAFEGAKLLSLTIEGIGSEATLSEYAGKEVVHTQRIEASNYKGAALSSLAWIARQADDRIPKLKKISVAGVRVVHGGDEFDSPVQIDSKVEEKIVALEKLAPLHNKSSIEVFSVLHQSLPNVPIYAVFDTVFHRTIPDYASSYAIPPELAKRHAIKRYGFHGISHRYLLERYAALASRSPRECNVVSMHLESGCSVSAIQKGGRSTIRWG